MGFLAKIFGKFSQDDINAAIESGNIALLTRAVKSRNSVTRVAAIDGLGHIDGEESTQVLVNALCNDHTDVRSAAVRSLEHKNWIPQEGAERVSWFIAKKDLKSLCQLSVEELMSEVELKKVTDIYSMVRMQAALIALKNAPETFGNSLLEILKSSEKDSALRGLAALALTVRRDVRAVKPLLEIYSGDQEELFDSVGTALQLFSELESVADPIIKVMLEKLKGKHRASAARILAYMGKRASGILSEKSSDKDLNASSRAMAGLALAGTGKLSGLRTAFENEGADVKLSCDTFFRMIEGKNLVQSYHTLYDYWRADDGMRLVTALGLGNTRDPEAIDLLAAMAKDDGNDSVRHEAIFSLGKMTAQQKARDVLLEAVDNMKWPMGERYGALIVLLWRDIDVPL